MKYKDYYAILGISKNAGEQEIKSAFRKLARKFHPDVNKAPDAVQKFKDLNEANEVLSDPEKRQRYDSLGSGWNQGSEFTPPPGHDFGQGGFSQGFGGFSDFFESIFGDLRQHQTQGYSSRRANQAPASENLDITQEIYLDLEDLMHNNMKAVRVSYLDKCPHCAGRKSNCYNCGGSGISSTSKVLNVKIPEKIKEGSKIRLANEGKSDSYGRKGNLYLIIKYKNHPHFKADGSDISSELEIQAPEAVLGILTQVETLHGMVKVSIPAGTQSGKSLRLRGLGLPKKSGSFGDHIVKIRINVPSNPSQNEKELYQKLFDLSKSKH